MTSSQPARAKPKSSAKAFWLKQLHTWHWVSSAVSLIGLLLFTITGFTLNHAAEIEASPTTVEKAAQLPPALLRHVAPDGAADAKKPLPAPVADWVRATFPTKAQGVAEWSADEVYLALPRPGGDGWIAIDRETGAVTSEATDRGWIAYLNDLHKGRNSGAVWKWFIDVFAFACLVFSLTGLALLWLHAKRRPSTWPLVVLGLAIPAALAVLFIHV
ncbi:PepSY-associated TM helix domain-containing protein [Sphingomonas sp.]|uniref:PepSY-associated TM helix domain-containing protein n=1 Tax=Sphingomonas sp. TaxID=28214 RepID=UPI002DD664B4|nr:PepSY-associated TM helix domain-containing protein [Sphingomonas sp.]